MVLFYLALPGEFFLCSQERGLKWNLKNLYSDSFEGFGKFIPLITRK